MPYIRTEGPDSAAFGWQEQVLEAVKGWSVPNHGASGDSMSSSTRSDGQERVDSMHRDTPTPTPDSGHPIDGHPIRDSSTSLDLAPITPRPTVLESDSNVSRSTRTTGRAPQRAKVRTFSATDRDNTMLETIAEYHGLTKSGTITSLIRREFWRIFPSGTEGIRPDQGARVDD